MSQPKKVVGVYDRPEGQKKSSRLVWIVIVVAILGALVYFLSE